MLALNFFLSLICFWIAFRINALFIQPARWNKHRFRLFDLRDNLAVLAMKGAVDESSSEYTTLMSMINDAVNQTQTFNAVDFLRFLFNLKKNDKVQNAVSDILKKCKSENSEYLSIFHGYFDVVQDMFNIQSRAFFWFIPPAITFLQFCSVLKSLASALSRKLEVLNTLRQDIAEKKTLTLEHGRI
jgi:hypothetical protein